MNCGRDLPVPIVHILVRCVALHHFPVLEQGLQYLALSKKTAHRVHLVLVLKR